MVDRPVEAVVPLLVPQQRVRPLLSTPPPPPPRAQSEAAPVPRGSAARGGALRRSDLRDTACARRLSACLLHPRYPSIHLYRDRMRRHETDISGLEPPCRAAPSAPQRKGTCSSSSTARRWPFCAARMIGVKRQLSCASMCAPARSSDSIARRLPLSAAQCSAECPSSPTARRRADARAADHAHARF